MRISLEAAGGPNPILRKGSGGGAHAKLPRRTRSRGRAACVKKGGKAMCGKQKKKAAIGFFATREARIGKAAKRAKTGDAQGR